jgi:hypothetical protein
VVIKLQWEEPEAPTAAALPELLAVAAVAPEVLGAAAVAPGVLAVAAVVLNKTSHKVGDTMETTV